MDRRDFLKAAVAAGVGLGLGGRYLPAISGKIPPAGWMPPAFAGESPVPLDIVAVRNGEPEVMFDRGIAAMGGMGRFVKKGSTVAIKPNVSWSSGVEMAGNTNPALVNRVVRHCREAGAAKVYVVDHTIEFWKSCFSASGIAAAAAEAGASLAPAESERYYVRRSGGGRVLRDAQIHEVALEADVLINIPVLKHHGGAGITAGIKNLMGLVWDRRFYHANDLHQCIADFLAFRRPDLNIVDAYRILTRNGPRSRHPGDVRLAKMQILSTDIVAADVSAARILGSDPQRYPHIAIAADMGFGQLDPAKLANRRLSL
ncbi:MAG: DUF362 domain-containing protein [Planctomycetota bacterium]|jgi:uncharacterized protein (DUF362 family)|nr:DUF362 domain-containing protein [Planctomycetota bacterium]